MVSARAIIAAALLLCAQAAAAEVELLYVGAADCGYCRRWEAQYLQHDRKPRASLDWAGVRFTIVDIGTFRAKFGAENAPAHLRPGMAKAMAAAGRTSLNGTPWFALFVDGEVRAQAFGTTGFESRIQPAIRAALREKAPGTRT